MRRQSYCPSSSSGNTGEPLIVVEEEADRCRVESPPRCVDPDSPSLNPYLLSPWRDARKHSLPTPQCTSGITASQVCAVHMHKKSFAVGAIDMCNISALCEREKFEIDWFSERQNCRSDRSWREKRQIHEKDSFIEVSKNLTKHKFENSFVGP